jgi:hypothetical protein
MSPCAGSHRPELTALDLAAADLPVVAMLAYRFPES